ncbi:MAG: cation transporter [Ponticaulis sp.]|nr:cation transporter [Ponticaulis sp.]|tara:strand:- start:22216 stop:22998 length:783 start_codon:yes stop_codon:yes gene_type:complete
MEQGSSGESKLSWINRALVFLVLLSLIMLALETEQTISDQAHDVLRALNVVVVSVFAVEYVLRFWAAGENEKYRGVKGHIRYAFSFYAIADLLAFLPELLIMMFAADHISPQMLAILKAFRLFRLFKLARYIPAFNLLRDAMRKAGSQLLISLFLALALVYVSAIALYLIEGEIQPDAFGSIPRAVWWAIATLTTVGYGDVFPITPAGRVAASCIALAGIGVVALPAGVFASSFSDVIRERQESRQEQDAKRSAMGENES